MSDIASLKARLESLEIKLRKLESGELSAEQLESKDDQKARQVEAISRTKFFIRSQKEAIAQAEKAAEAKVTATKKPLR